MPRLRSRRDSKSSAFLSRPASRSGFTLLEVLIATAVTLLMMISLAQIFKTIGDSMRQGRAALELNNRLRSVVYRIRLDLENATASPRPPADPTAGQGYFEYYDGSATDYTGAVLTQTLNSDADPTNDIQDASRYGDFDDILMFTARAGDTWFTGKVPRYVLAGGTVGTTPTPAELELVTIASQHAEIAVFAQPLVSDIGNPTRDPSGLIVDRTAYADANTDGIPDSFRLHYRTLLIRPDLNLSNGHLPSTNLSTANPYLFCQPQTITFNSVATNLPSPLCDMYRAHGQCDLSIRRVFDSSDGLTGTSDYVAANSLEDLVDPANRFAHVQVPIFGTESTSMPLIACEQAIGIFTTPATDPYRDPFGTDSGSAIGNLVVGSGLLHPAYALLGGRAGEDIIASDILAFDVKGFDPSVPLLLGLGPNGVTDSGAAGSDDVVLTPNDPGYGNASGLTSIGTGEYVDLGWGRKILRHFGSGSAPSLVSALSGISSGTVFSNSLRKSGKVLNVSAGLAIMQLSYDTWTTEYEGDGYLQAGLGGYTGIMHLNGRQNLYGVSSGGNDVANAISSDWNTPSGRASLIDAGTDGIDNSGSLAGVDDISEQETSAPFPVDLRGIKITVRMEDPVTREIKQMSHATEFVTQ